ncbi:MAG: DUF3298 domain-containing protein [Haliscomenobacter sp.]|nr:DUF3298 domain-containing protein [Haliscomenobacter sp.]
MQRAGFGGSFVRKRSGTNGNFFLTGKGICFNYVPYEIGAYAAGELSFCAVHGLKRC